MNTIYQEVQEREELITKIDTLSKLYLSANKTAEKRAIYTRLVDLRIALSKMHNSAETETFAFFKSALENNATYLN